jgi:hypothetical protein
MFSFLKFSFDSLYINYPEAFHCDNSTQPPLYLPHSLLLLHFLISFWWVPTLCVFRCIYAMNLLHTKMQDLPS